MPDCQSCEYPCVEKNKKNGKDIVHGKRVLDCVYENSLPSGDLNTIMLHLQTRVQHAQQELSLNPTNIQDNTFNNIRGYWTQCIFAFLSWNIFCSNATVGNSCLVSLPATTSLRFTDIFDVESSTALNSGLIKRLSEQGITMSMSNPDFVCISDITPNEIDYFKVPIRDISLKSQQRMELAYKRILNYCPYYGLKFGIALKTSLRSDRRYQVAYEGSILKALIAHLQVRFWDTSFDTKYYAIIANKVNNEDRRILTAPATHSIIDVHTPPVKAIDEIFEVKSTADIETCVNKIIQYNFNQNS